MGKEYQSPKQVIQSYLEERAKRDPLFATSYAKPNKKGGAYSMGVYGVHPFVLANFVNSKRDVSTIAHELGHSMHSYYSNKEQLPKLEEELKFLLIPKDPDDDKNIICEIRAGAGGEEAALFAGTLFRMYNMYAERKHWKLEILNENATELGGYKEISFMITGKGAYSRLKYESGVHRVQRVPDTESSGRIHTSTATVAVLPVVEDVEIEINPADIKMEVFRASGAGGQHVNKTSSAVRLIHVPTGIVAECQTERSQLQNREYAMKLLRSRLYEIEKTKQDNALANERKSQIGSGDRSEKIRTYNYPQGRITDHRIGLSIFQMEDFLNGNLDNMIDSLTAAHMAEKLKGNEEE